jgi:conjugative transposon TraK protein
MFQHFKNIDTAFRHVRLISFLVIGVCGLVCCFTVWKSYQSVDNYKEHIYILASGKALEAVAAGRKDNVPVEARDHIKTFHEDFFTMDPDEKVIRANMTRALYLADESARRQYDNLREQGYYASLISGNISQQVTVDSIRLDMDTYPYAFRCFAHEQLIRSTSVTLRILVTQGELRNVGRSDNNPHGFLISRWEILENRDEGVKDGK